MKHFSINAFFLFLIFGAIVASYKFTKDSCGYPHEEYKNGEVLLPDYVHVDTLVVTNAKLLNQLMPCTDGSDGQIMHVLRQTTRVK